MRLIFPVSNKSRKTVIFCKIFKFINLFKMSISILFYRIISSKHSSIISKMWYSNFFKKNKTQILKPMQTFSVSKFQSFSIFIFPFFDSNIPKHNNIIVLNLYYICYWRWSICCFFNLIYHMWIFGIQKK